MRDGPPASASMNAAGRKRGADRSGGTMRVRRRRETDSAAETRGQRAGWFARDALPHLAQLYPAAATSRLHRGRRQLRDLLQDSPATRRRATKAPCRDTPPGTADAGRPR